MMVQIFQRVDEDGIPFSAGAVSDLVCGRTRGGRTCSRNHGLLPQGERSKVVEIRAVTMATASTPSHIMAWATRGHSAVVP